MLSETSATTGKPLNVSRTQSAVVPHARRRLIISIIAILAIMCGIMPILFMISTGSILAAGVSVLVGLGFMMIFIPVLKACFRTRRSEAERMFSYSGALFIVLALAIASVAALSHLSGGATDGKAYAKTLVVRR